MIKNVTALFSMIVGLLLATSTGFAKTGSVDANVVPAQSIGTDCGGSPVKYHW